MNELVDHARGDDLVTEDPQSCMFEVTISDAPMAVTDQAEQGVPHVGARAHAAVGRAPTREGRDTSQAAAGAPILDWRVRSLWHGGIDLDSMLGARASFPGANEHESKKVTTGAGEAKLDHPPTGGA